VRLEGSGKLKKSTSSGLYIHLLLLIADNYLTIFKVNNLFISPASLPREWKYLPAPVLEQS
jgi:hypothetical protein